MNFPGPLESRTKAAKEFTVGACWNANKTGCERVTRVEERNQFTKKEIIPYHLFRHTGEVGNVCVLVFVQFSHISSARPGAPRPDAKLTFISYLISFQTIFHNPIPTPLNFTPKAQNVFNAMISEIRTTTAITHSRFVIGACFSDKTSVFLHFVFP